MDEDKQNKNTTQKNYNVEEHGHHQNRGVNTGGSK
jgi:hypothetical protein